MTSTSQFQDANVETRKRLDDEISQLETQLISLKLARNALAPVMCLHPEILQEIFFLTHYTSPHKGTGTLLLTWICHRWRELAHNNAALWSHIDFKNLEWVEAALSRTKNRELEFNLLNFNQRTMQYLPELTSLTLGNLSRIRFLKISSTYGTNQTIALKDVPRWLNPAPLLVDLHLRGLNLPSHLFLGVIPRLQFLEIHNCALDWNTLLLPSGLKRLSISYPTVDLPTLDYIAKILQTVAPSLEELRFQNILDNQNEPPILHTDKVRLDKLKSIKIEEHTPNEIALLFNLITLPSRVISEISISEWSESTDSHIFQVLVAARNLEKWPVDLLEVRVEDDSFALRIIEEWSKPVEDLHAAEVEGAKQTDFQIQLSNFDELSSFLPAFTILPIQPIEKVSFFGGYDEQQDTTILDYIGKLGTVREMQIEVSFLNTFLTSIGGQNETLNFDSILSSGLGYARHRGAPTHNFDSERKTSAQATISFNHLRALEIYGNPEAKYLFTSEDLSVLRRWLEWRNKYELRVERLCISGLHTPPTSWLTDAFERIVDEFEMRDLEEDEDALLTGED